MYTFVLKSVVIFTFCRDGKEIKNTAKTAISQTEEMCFLKLPKFARTDAGLYKCVATNSAGMAECEATIIVDGKCRFWQIIYQYISCFGAI